MTGDAQAEAKGIVEDLAMAVVAVVAASDDDEAYQALKANVVAALAAAIEVRRARMDRDAQKARPVEEAMRRNIEAHEELERALSALREPHDTEGTA